VRIGVGWEWFRIVSVARSANVLHLPVLLPGFHRPYADAMFPDNVPNLRYIIGFPINRPACR
jgi:hypothetical protein